MIVPGTRLLWLSGLIGLPALALPAVWPAAFFLSIAALTLLCVVALIDALRANRAWTQLHVSAAPITRMFKDRPAPFHLRIDHPARAARKLRIGLAWPAEIIPDHDDLWTVLPANEPAVEVAWTCLPRQRGTYRFDRCYLETPSPWQLWAARLSQPLACTITVYTNLQAELRRTPARFLRRSTVGSRPQRLLGRGREFEKLRDYAPGDAYGDVDWKATARRGKPVTRVFQAERSQEIYVVVDASRLTARDSGLPGETVLERFVSAALLVGLAAERAGDRFGLATFSDTVHSFVRAGKGTAHYAACRETLSTLQPRLVTPDYDELATLLRVRLPRRALLLLLTELDDPALAESFQRAASLLRRQHLVHAAVAVPPGVQPLFQDNPSDLDAVYESLGHHLLWRQLQDLRTTLQRDGIRLSLLRPESLGAEVAMIYREVKERQAL